MRARLTLCPRCASEPRTRVRRRIETCDRGDTDGVGGVVNPVMRAQAACGASAAGVEGPAPAAGVGMGEGTVMML